jgi:toxin ParE1/3/4
MLPSGTSSVGDGLGLEFLAAVDEGLQRIRSDPQQFPRLETLPNEEQVRRLRLDRFPYVLIYEAGSGEIRILAVAHARRAPGYWIERR